MLQVTSISKVDSLTHPVKNTKFEAICWVDVQKLITYFENNSELLQTPFICELLTAELNKSLLYDDEIQIESYHVELDGLVETLLQGLEYNPNVCHYGILSMVHDETLRAYLSPKDYNTFVLRENSTPAKTRIIHSNFRIAILNRLLNKGIEKFPIIASIIENEQ